MEDKRVCIDTNILLDILLGRTRANTAGRLLRDRQIYTTSLSIVTAYYVAKKDQDFNEDVFYESISILHILPVSGETIHQGKILAQGGDLEDGVQVAATVYGGIQYFLTADKSLAKKYKDALHITVVA